MDTFRKLREQVTKQGVFKLGGYSASQGPDSVITDEAELQRHQQLERLYLSTRAAKHFQREVVRGVENFISTGAKQMEVATKLGEDCSKYGTEGPSGGGALARASHHFGSALQQMEKERESLHRSLGTQVAEPLRAMVTGAPLEDARHLCQRYDRLRQEAESTAIDLSRRQAKAREVGNMPEMANKLTQIETKLGELSAAMHSIGKEAAAAMISVEAQQQRLTYHRLVAMIEAERAYHKRLADILDQAHGQITSERQRNEMSPNANVASETHTLPPSYDEIKQNGPDLTSHNAVPTATQKSMNFLAEVLHSFEAEGPGELSLIVGDYVVVRQVLGSGWCEGESKSKCGWFPNSHIERRARAPASKVIESGFQLV